MLCCSFARDPCSGRPTWRENWALHGRDDDDNDDDDDADDDVCSLSGVWCRRLPTSPRGAKTRQKNITSVLIVWTDSHIVA
jgi:hypothetical protein